MICLNNELMKKHTTFRTGGAAKKFYKVESAEEIINIINECNKNNEKYMILGNGSNLLVSDRGFDGAVIQICDLMNDIKVTDDRIYAGAGAFLSAIAKAALDNELGGFEFASGIPGTLGGGIVMNAGAYGGELENVVTYVDVIKDGKLMKLTNEDMKFDYRYSIAMDVDMVIVGAEIKLKKSDSKKIADEMSRLASERKKKQPLEYPSAGSTFKRPEGYFAGKLIMESGLSGYRVGGAMVSEKHCGFVINYENATSEDVYKLILDVKDKVYQECKVVLEPEVKFVGDFSYI